MRARNLKPGFFKNEDLAELCPLARILFQGLWCMADRDGRLEDRPKRIKAEVLPYDDCDADELLNQLAQAGFIRRYAVGEHRVILVTNFAKHQNPHVREGASTLPAPPEHSASTVQAPDEHQAGHISAPDMYQTSPAESPFSESPLAESPSLTAESPTQARARTRGGQDRPASELVLVTGQPERPYGLYVALLEELGTDEAGLSPAFKGKQLSIAKRLLEQGFGEQKVRGYVRYLLAEAADWRTDPIDLFTVEKGIGKWEANGSPPLPKPHAASRRGARQAAPDYSGIDAFSRQMDAIEAKGQLRGA